MEATTKARTPTVIDLLEREWRVLAASAEAGAALEEWRADHAVLRRFETMRDLVAYVECRTAPAGERDQVLAALAMRAGSDQLAARTVLQLLLPGCKALVGRYRRSAESADELAAEVVSDVYARIRAFADRCAHSYVAAGILSGTKKRLVRVGAARAREASLEDEPDALDLAQCETEPSAAEELAELLEWASSAGHLSPAEAELISLSRAGAVPLSQLCHGDASPVVASVRQRRNRAERRLALAVAAA